MPVGDIYQLMIQMMLYLNYKKGVIIILGQSFSFLIATTYTYSGIKIDWTNPESDTSE